MTSIGSGQVIDYSDSNYWENFRQRSHVAIDTIVDTTSRGAEVFLTQSVANRLIPNLTNGTKTCLRKINICGPCLDPAIDTCTKVTGETLGKVIGAHTAHLVVTGGNYAVKPIGKKVVDCCIDSTNGCVKNIRDYLQRSPGQ